MIGTSVTRCLLTAVLATAVSAACAAPAIAPPCLVSATGIGPVSLGMTLADAQRALPGATFARSSDGDGVALITVSIADSALFSAFAGEADASATLSEIESREYIEFERQPAGLLFRLDYSGRFADGSRETKEYAPNARIFSVGVVQQN